MRRVYVETSVWGMVPPGQMTLDEYLAKIDGWKQPVSDRMLELTPEQRAEHDREARAWLESELGRPLKVAAQPEPIAKPQPD